MYTYYAVTPDQSRTKSRLLYLFLRVWGCLARLSRLALAGVVIAAEPWIELRVFESPHLFVRSVGSRMGI